MKIDDIHVDGFGRFNQLSIEDLQPGLTIFSGANEAGKSTLLAFIRFMLFGFSSTKTSPNRYPPLLGGKHGGRMVITTDSDERCVIERYVERGSTAKVTHSDGSLGDSGGFSKLLGYADQNIFENVYAFGLNELQKFDSLNNDSIHDKLYSVGAGLGSVSISDVQKYLKKQNENLYKKQGRKPPMNKLFIDIKELDIRINDLEKDQSKYDSLHRDLETKSRLIEQLRNERLDIKKKLDHVEDMMSVWDDWNDLQDLQALLKELPILETFPENGSNDLERILEKREEITDMISSLKENMDKNDIEINNITLNENLLQQRDTILDLGNGIEKYRSERDLLPVLKGKLEEEQSDFSDLLNELGPQWNVEKLNRFDRSIPARETVIQKRKAIEEIGTAIIEIQNELTQANRNIERINADIERNNEKQDQHEVQINDEEVEQRLDAIRNLRVKDPVLNDKKSELKSIKKEEALLTTIQPKTITIGQQSPLWPASVIVMAAILCLAYGYFIDKLLLGTTMFILLTATAVVYFISIRRNISKFGETPDDSDITKDKLQQKSFKQQLETEIESLNKEMLNFANLCGFNEIPQPELREQKYDDLQGDKTKLKTVSDLRADQEGLLKEKKKLDEQVAELREKLADEETTLSKMYHEWENWLSNYDLDSNLSPESILEIFSTIKTCYLKQKTITTLESQISSIEISIQAYEDKIISVLEKCGRVRSGISLDTELENLRADVESERGNSEQLEQLRTYGKKHFVELESAEVKYNKLEKDLLNMLAAGSSNNEEGFRKNAHIWNEHVRLNNEIKTAISQIRRVSGDGELYDRFISELEIVDINKLERNQLELQECLEALDTEISTATDERGGIRNQIEQLEYRAEGSMLRMKKEVLNEDLHKKSRDWASYVLAQDILRRAIEVYEKERQPAVIVEAQSFFSSITHGRYKRIYSPVGSSDIFVEDNDGRQKETFQLSKGTVEQLYLALRFGFIKEIGKHSETLPIIFDDILVNFDPIRSKTAGDAIKQLATTNQIFYFTCHPDTVKILKDIAPDAKIIGLDDV